MADAPAPPSPKGVVAIVTNDRGDVIAHAADFARDGYGGCELWEAQRLRAERSAIFATLNAYASPVLVAAIGDYHGEQIFGELRRKAGHKLTLRAVGWPEDVALAIEERNR